MLFKGEKMCSIVTSQGLRRRRWSSHRLVLLKSKIMSRKVPLIRQGQMMVDVTRIATVEVER
jgi:hypothetical protein